MPETGEFGLNRRPGHAVGSSSLGPGDRDTASGGTGTRSRATQHSVGARTPSIPSFRQGLPEPSRQGVGGVVTDPPRSPGSSSHHRSPRSRPGSNRTGSSFPSSPVVPAGTAGTTVGGLPKWGRGYRPGPVPGHWVPAIPAGTTVGGPSWMGSMVSTGPSPWPLGSGSPCRNDGWVSSWVGSTGVFDGKSTAVASIVTVKKRPSWCLYKGSSVASRSSPIAWGGLSGDSSKRSPCKRSSACGSAAIVLSRWPAADTGVLNSRRFSVLEPARGCP